MHSLISVESLKLIVTNSLFMLDSTSDNFSSFGVYLVILEYICFSFGFDQYFLKLVMKSNCWRVLTCIYGV